MSISSDIRKKENDITKLNQQKRDLMDDGGDISGINRKIAELQEDFQKFLTSNHTGTIVNKIGELVEPLQSNDGNLQRSCEYIDTEINALQREIRALEQAREAARKAKDTLTGGSFGGGGGGGGIR